MEQRFLTPAELEQKAGIKAQHAVYRALKDHLTRVNTGWDVQETAVGSQEDKAGVDIYLVHAATQEARLLDISFRDKPDVIFLVRVRNDWFAKNQDGSWYVRKECLHALLRAILPALSAPSVRRH